MVECTKGKSVGVCVVGGLVCILVCVYTGECVYVYVYFPLVKRYTSLRRESEMSMMSCIHGR